MHLEELLDRVDYFDCRTSAVNPNRQADAAVFTCGCPDSVDSAQSSNEVSQPPTTAGLIETLRGITDLAEP
jgi:hypothetical protein